MKSIPLPFIQEPKGKAKVTRGAGTGLRWDLCEAIRLFPPTCKAGYLSLVGSRHPPSKDGNKRRPLMPSSDSLLYPPMSPRRGSKCSLTMGITPMSLVGRGNERMRMNVYPVSWNRMNWPAWDKKGSFNPTAPPRKIWGTCHGHNRPNPEYNCRSQVVMK
jgi:hypothetical protein